MRGKPATRENIVFVLYLFMDSLNGSFSWKGTMDSPLQCCILYTTFIWSAKNFALKPCWRVFVLL